jgi:dipeptidyl aminopeptidase/acylaminoacyl peptidase
VNVTRFVSPNSPALQVRHGVVDALVSIKQARLLKRAIDECGTVLDYREIPDADHGFIGMGNPETLVDEGIAFLKANS